MFRSSYRVATVWGIPIKIHISLIALALLVAFPSLIRGDILGLLFALVAITAVVTSIALHELGHSFVALRKGCRIREITLMFMGGVAQMLQIPKRPRDEFEMAIAGPLVSVALGCLTWFGGAHLPLTSSWWPLPLLPGSLKVSCNVVQFLGVLNFGWAVFNLLPAFPMDGGRVLRALLTPKLGRLRATFVAARLGKIVAVLFGIHGFFNHNWVLVFIAFFVYTAAGNEYRSIEMQEAARMRQDPWPPFETGGDEDDKVSIGPPPYEDGPGSETEIHSCRRKDPFRGLFR